MDRRRLCMPGFIDVQYQRTVCRDDLGLRGGTYCCGVRLCRCLSRLSGTSHIVLSLEEDNRRLQQIVPTGAWSTADDAKRRNISLLV